MNIVLWLLAVSCGVVGRASSVLSVDGDNFYATLREHPRLMLFFYAPWCGHSKKMEPEFEKAASSLQGNVAFGRIDASLEVEIADEFGLKSYPGIFLLHRAHWEEYTGRRHEHAMVEWLRNKVGPALEVKKSEAELQAALANRGPGAAFIARGDEKLQEAMSRVAERNRSLGSFFFLRGHGPSEVLLHHGLGESISIEAAFDNPDFESTLPAVLRSALLPSFGEVAEENFFHYESGNFDALLWALFANSTDGTPCSRSRCMEQAWEHAEMLRAVADGFENIKAVFVDVHTYKEYVVNELGCDEFPALLLQKGPLTDDMLPRYVLPFTSDLDAKAVTAWVTQALADGATSEPTSKDDL